MDAPRDVRSLIDTLEATFGGPTAEPAADPAFAQAFERLLEPFGWRGRARAKLEAAPFHRPIEDLVTFRATLARLGVETRLQQRRLTTTGPLAPALILHGGGVYCLMADGVLTDAAGAPARIAGDPIVQVVHPARREDVPEGETRPWTVEQFKHLRGDVALMLAASLIITLLALAPPFFAMAVYEHVIRPGSLATLAGLMGCAGLAIWAEILVRDYRARRMARLGARFDAALQTAVFAKLMDLPIRYTTSAPVSQQLDRLREFENIRAAFATHAATALLDAPFAVLIILGLLIAAPAVGLAPALLVLAYAILAALASPTLARLGRASARAQARMQALMREGFLKAASIRQLGAEGIWNERVRVLSRHAAQARFKLQLWEEATGATAQTMAAAAGATAVVVGAVQVMSGAMSVGALVAVMLIVWRVIQPVHAGFASLRRILLFLQARKHADALLAIPGERRGRAAAAPKRAFSGAIRVEGLGYRPAGSPDAPLRNVSFEIPAGQVVALCGPAGAGKSTLLRLMIGLHEPAAGGVFFDGVNLRQIDSYEHRSTIAYVATEPALLRGTLAQNMRLMAPEASDDALRAALALAGVGDDDPELPLGLETLLQRPGRAPLSRALTVKVQLAAAYARGAPALLLDDPGANLDQAGDVALAAQLRALAGRTTVLIVTNRPSHMLACQRVLRLANGVITHDGAPSSVAPLLINSRTPQKASA